VISSSAVVETKKIGTNVVIGEFCVIRDDVQIGNNVVIHPYVIIESGVKIGAEAEIFPGCYIGKTPKGVGATSRPISYKPFVVLGNHCAIGPHAIIYYNVEIGDNTLVGDGASIREETCIGSSCVIGRYVTINYNSKIADRVKIMDHTWLAGNLIVGDGVFISGGVMTANDNNMGIQGYQDHLVKGPTIEEGVRIGCGAILLPSITIGQHSVIAAGSVVTKDVPPNKMVMGIPAKQKNHTWQ
jgi:acetyltransferase-like isoleucine patch superfamily enzyme